MRPLLILALLTTTAALAAQPAPGRYCASGYPDIAVGPGRGHLYIDLSDCQGARYSPGRVTARRCVGLGGASFPYDTDVSIRPDGSIEHDGQVYRRALGGAPCP